MAANLKEALAQRTTVGELFESLPDARVRCFACGHRCTIPPGHEGICRVRFNVGGALRVPRGYVGALQCDPIEKKPFFHVLPGSLALSFGMLGCDLHCGYCQNWLTSQVLRDASAVAPPRVASPEHLVERALALGARVVASTYNEPLITAEWAVEVFRVARAAGLKTAFISNGNATPQVLDYLRPWVDLYKVDLKSMQDRTYRRLGGVLDNVLASIRGIHERGFWLEVVTLVVPGFNDSRDEFRRAADFLASLSTQIPWHVTAFHEDYKMKGMGGTPVATLLEAARIGQSAGLRYVYAGNAPGRLGDLESTHCPRCRALLVERIGYQILANRLTDGACPDCGERIPGAWV